jgi:hypothetical protein
MLDTASETQALPFEEAASSSTIHNPQSLQFASIGVHSRFSFFFKRTFGTKFPA